METKWGRAAKKVVSAILLRNYFPAVANALSIPPGEYARKSETQRNWRGPAQAVDYVV